MSTVMAFPTPSKNIFIVTGANAGLGFKASSDLAKLPDAHVIMAGRSIERLEAAAKRVREATEGVGSIVETALVDLSSSESVSKFCASVKLRSPALSSLTILCNASVSLPTKILTADGLEMTFAVNHLGHFQLVTSLLDITKRVVIVSSETHDPAENAPNPPPSELDLEQLARGLEPYNWGVAYSSSKLLNLLFMTELLHRNPTGLEVIGYTPGMAPDTELGRHHDQVSLDLDAIIAMCKDRGIRVSSTEYSGGFMASICAERDWSSRGWKSGMYIRVDEPSRTSTQAQDPKLAKEVWELSEKLIKELP